MLALNVELLERTKQRILNYPTTFDMDHFLSEKEGCGTVACIAGHLAILQAEDKAAELSPSWVTYEAAAALLGITVKEAYCRWERAERIRLFYTYLWPTSLRIKYAASQNAAEKARVAAEAIDYFIEHPGEILA